MNENVLDPISVVRVRAHESTFHLEETIRSFYFARGFQDLRSRGQTFEEARGQRSVACMTWQFQGSQ